MQATDGDSAARKPIMVINGKPYRRHKLTVRAEPLTKHVPTPGRPGWVDVVTYEPVEVR
jgi:hypothetical protein